MVLVYGERTSHRITTHAHTHGLGLCVCHNWLSTTVGHACSQHTAESIPTATPPPHTTERLSDLAETCTERDVAIVTYHPHTNLPTHHTHPPISVCFRLSIYASYYYSNIHPSSSYTYTHLLLQLQHTSTPSYTHAHTHTYR